MPPSPALRRAPRQARSQAMVELILEAATRVLVEQGYAKATTNRIAEAAGISVGSLYQYFGNKAALVSELHRRHSDHMVELIERVLDESAAFSLSCGIRALVRGVLQAHLIEPELHRVLEGEVPEPDIGAKCEHLKQKLTDSMERFITQHPQDVRVPDPRLAARISMQMLDQLLHAAVLEPAPETPGAIEDEVVAAVMGYLTYDRHITARHDNYQSRSVELSNDWG